MSPLPRRPGLDPPEKARRGGVLLGEYWSARLGEVARRLFALRLLGHFHIPVHGFASQY